MKSLSYLAAMEKGVYDGNTKYESGSIEFGKDTIYDWNNKGFGEITYDEGFLYSSNVAISYMTKEYFTADELREYFKKFGFGKKTGIELPGELSGTLNFTYPVEIANAGFGQGITITPIQMIQAMTTIANDGVMLKPYIVDKIVDTNINETIYEGGRKELGKVVSTKTVNQIKDLLYRVIYNDLYYSTGSGFKMKVYDLMGKTGTAQYVDSTSGRYFYDDINYIRSFVGMFPKDDPQIIIYTALKKNYSARGIQNIVKGLVKDISNYKGIYNPDINTDATSYIIENYKNKSLDTTLNDLKEKFSDVIVIGNGTKIINQYPKENTNLSVTEKVYLLTDGNEITMPNITNWSLREVNIYSSLTGIKVESTGSGYVISQSIEENTKIKKDDKLKIELKSKLK